MSQRMEMEGGGYLCQWEEGERVCFRCETPLRKDGIYKVWLRGDGGELLLGTLMPEGEGMILCRAVSRQELRRCGCWPVRSVGCVMTYSFRQQRNRADGWYWEQDPGHLVDEETGKLGTWQPMLCRKEKAGIALAWPVKGDAPIPLVHLFCLAEIRQIRGEMHFLWHFNANGGPCFPEKRDC